MSPFEIYTLILSVMAVVIIPLGALLYRIGSRVARVDGKLVTMARDFRALVVRVRWLENYLRDRPRKQGRR